MCMPQVWFPAPHGLLSFIGYDRLPSPHSWEKSTPNKIDISEIAYDVLGADDQILSACFLQRTLKFNQVIIVYPQFIMHACALIQVHKIHSICLYIALLRRHPTPTRKLEPSQPSSKVMNVLERFYLGIREIGHRSGLLAPGPEFKL